MVWDWDLFVEQLTSTGFLEAAWTTVWLTVVAEGLAVALGGVVALGMLSTSRPVVAISGLYVWIWRGTPILVQLLVLYFGLPQIGIRPSVLQAALLGLVLNEGAYIAVLLRANLLAVPVGQSDAGRVLGLRRWQRIRLILLPQAIRTFLPALGNQVNSMIKTTSLVSVLSVQELLAHTRDTVSETYRPFEAFAVATVYYLAISSLWNLVQWALERRSDVTRRGGRRRPAVPAQLSRIGAP
ncbi:amino acid ABC transporter permease [Nakamurella endophytica]|uniref:ABC transporter permease n=1 Tax=Nakamurella endophytica TaxID=1748367 RepID=A0A917SUD0_9ACTN|nr:amino acid ABC transporter permease [Nakamurella endophytica]GGL98108.1 ABC transporter permease [Nakamurella endophytica]